MTQPKPYFYVQPKDGRWLVVHDVPGAAVASIDDDCLTEGAANREAGWRNAERDRQQRQLAQERAMLGWREAPAGWAA